MPDEPADLPVEAGRRLRSATFTSGLSAPDFAAALQAGLTPVGLVQGFCVMRWSWYGAGNTMLGPGGPYAGRAIGGYAESYTCPHGFVSAEHRTWGQNYEQPWFESAWREGFGSAYRRMVEEAVDAGAHGVVGVVDTTRPLTEGDVIEFHLRGTAVVDSSSGPPGGDVWTTYLSGQRLNKLREAGYAPVAVAAAVASVRVWAYCVTEFLMEGRGYYYGSVSSGEEITQMSRAHTAARRLAREHIRSQLGADTLHGASLSVSERHAGQGDREINCILKGTRVRRVGDFRPLDPPRPTVVLR